MNPLAVDRIRADGFLLPERVAIRRQEILRMKREHASTDVELRLRKRYSTPATGRLELSCVSGGEWTPACELHLQRHLGLPEANCRKWKSGLEPPPVCLLEIVGAPQQPPG